MRVVPVPSWATQRDADLRLEWGPRGVEALAPHVDALVVVDVLSFSTTVDVAVARGAVVLPYRWRDATAAAFAAAEDATLAAARDGPGYSLSPASFVAAPPGLRVVLPSPNGATLALLAGATPLYAGCLRNARAVARAARRHGARLGVVAAGERWPDDATLRPAVEDLLGAGAVLDALPGSRSPEAEAAVAAFRAARERGLLDVISTCASGRELAEWGFDEDVRLAAALDASGAAPRLVDGAFVDAA